MSDSNLTYTKAKDSSQAIEALDSWNLKRFSHEDVQSFFGDSLGTDTYAELVSDLESIAGIPYNGESRRCTVFAEEAYLAINRIIDTKIFEVEKLVIGGTIVSNGVKEKTSHAMVLVTRRSDKSTIMVEPQSTKTYVFRFPNAVWTDALDDALVDHYKANGKMLSRENLEALFLSGYESPMDS